MDNIEELRIIFKLTYSGLSNGELYHLLRSNQEFRIKYWFCDERLKKWYIRDNGRIWKKDVVIHKLSTK